jgi:hypothetical protein
MHPENLSVQLPFSAQATAAALIIKLLPDRDKVPLRGIHPKTCTKIIRTLITSFPQLPHIHGYLAIYHTPLHQLLALTGNTWLFGRKLTSPTEFDACAPAIKSWSATPAAAHATWHACNLLKHIFESSTSSRILRGVSEYWFIYTSALIVWAFGHRPYRASVAAGPSRASLSRHASSVTLARDDLSRGQQFTQVRAAAYAWVGAITKLEPEQMFNSPLRAEMAVVIDASRWMLEDESAYGKSGMLLDACGVLGRLQEGDRLC